MNQPTRIRRSVKYQSAADWPAWTDEVRWEPTGPSEADARWVADNLNGHDWHDQDEPVPDDILDRQAAEAEALDRLEQGYGF